MPRLRLDPLSPSGVSIAPDGPTIGQLKRSQGNGYVSNKATGLIAAGTNVTLSGSGVSNDPYIISSTGGSGGTVSDATTTAKGIVQLAGDLSGTAALPTVPGLANKVDKTTTVNSKALSSNITLSNTDVGAAATVHTHAESDVTNLTTDLAAKQATLVSGTNIKTVNGNSLLGSGDLTIAGGTTADATTTSKGIVQLAGDLGGTASAPTVPGLANKAPIASPTFTGTAGVTGANGTLSIYTTTDGGEFNVASNASGKLAIFGTSANTLDVNLLDGALYIASTLILTNARVMSNVDFTGTGNTWPTFNQNTTGTASNVTGTVAVGNGGTGATSLTGILKGNGTSAVSAVTAPTGAIVGTTDTQTMTNKTLSTGSTIDANVTVTEVLKKVYPVGSIYTNATDSTNPATLLGFGTWTAFASGRVPVGKAATGTFATIGATGGEETHLLTAAEMPAHNHAPTGGGAFISSGTGSGANVTTGGGGYAANTTTASAGSGTAHNNLQPYIVVYMWQRTA